MTIRTEASPRSEENVASMLQHCAYFIKWFYLDPPAEEMESDSVIDMPTATVSEDQIDVEIVAVFPRFPMKLARQRLKAQRGELLQWCMFGFGVLDKYNS